MKKLIPEFPREMPKIVTEKMSNRDCGEVETSGAA